MTISAGASKSLKRRTAIRAPSMTPKAQAGNVLWLHGMGGIKRAPLGFLHHWYYQSLEAGRGVRE